MKNKAVGPRSVLKPAEKPATEASQVETSGGLHDGCLIELVRHRASSELALIKITADGSTVSNQINHDGVVFVPPQDPGPTIRAMLLPNRMHAMPVTSKEICQEIVSACGDLVDDSSAWLLSVIVLASWALDWLSAAPALAVIGPRNLALELLKLLACMCRRSLLLGDLSQTGFRLLPFEMQPTLLLGSVDRAVHRTLSTSNVPGLPIVQGDRLVDPFCVSIIYAASPYMPPRGEERYRIIIRPDATPNRRSATELKDIAAHLQPMLLRFRADLALKQAGREQKTKGPPAQGHARELVSLFFSEDIETRDRILDPLLAQQDALQRSQRSGVPALVIEVLLAQVHLQKAVVTVGEVAKDANAILLSRGENYDLQARAVGSVLDELGIEREDRNAQGFRVRLSQDMGRHIHELARTYRVPNRKPGCGSCEEVFGGVPG